MENKIYLVTADWCTKCPLVKGAIIDKGIEVEFIDAEQQPEIPSELGIMSLPTLVDNRDGESKVYAGLSASMMFVNEQ